MAKGVLAYNTHLTDMEILHERYDGPRVPCKLELTIWLIPV